MKKWVLPLAGVAMGLVVIVLLITLMSSKPIQPPVLFEARSAATDKAPFVACYQETGDIGTDTGYLLIDLSDSTNWPHSSTNAAILRRVYLQGSVDGHEEWHSSIGAVVVSGTAEFILGNILTHITGTFLLDHEWAGSGLDLWVESDELLYAATHFSDTTSAYWHTDTAISTTAGAATGLVGVGDVVLWMNEIADGSTVDFVVCVEYDTR